MSQIEYSESARALNTDSKIFNDRVRGMKTMRQTLLLLLSSFGQVMAQVPLTTDPAVSGAMHISVKEEMAETLSAEVSADFEYSKAFQVMLVQEFHEENQLLRDRGSLYLSNGGIISENVDAGEQIIDPRTPKGFGDPFFRKIHVEMNQEMNMSPMMKEALAKTTSELELPVGCTSLDTCIDYDRDGYSDAIKDWEVFIGRNVTFTNANYMEEIDSVINRTTYYNGTTIDYVTSDVCITSYGSKSCTTKEYVVNENSWDLEVMLFPDGICPHPCECVRSMGATRALGDTLVEKCFDSCAGSQLLDILNCKILQQAGNKNRMTMKMLLDERLPGWGPGLTMRRSHPLAGEIRRFMGIF